MAFSTIQEQRALDAAVDAAGEVVADMIAGGYGSDLDSWPEEAFPGFVTSIVAAYQDKLRAQLASGEPPF